MNTPVRLMWSFPLWPPKMLWVSQCYRFLIFKSGLSDQLLPFTSVLFVSVESNPVLLSAADQGSSARAHGQGGLVGQINI